LIELKDQCVVVTGGDGSRLANCASRCRILLLNRLCPAPNSNITVEEFAMKIMVIVVLSFTGLLLAQQPSAEAPQNVTAVSSRTPEKQSQPARDQDLPQVNSSYILGPGDQISFRVVDLEEITDKPISVDLIGYVRLPMVGRIKVAGLTIAQLEAGLAKQLEVYLLHPDVSVSIVEFRSQPVPVIGAVKTPGVQQVQGRKTLLEVLSLAGGLDTTAGSTLKITRRVEWGRIPLAGATDDPTGQFSVAEVSVKSIMEARNPEENILVKPYDVISVPRAETIYVIGQVLKSGGFVLNDREKVTVLQALSMAGGLDRMAQAQNARILRRQEGDSNRTEIAVDLTRILSGKVPDVPMESEDILFVPNSLPKRAAIRALETAVQMGTGIVIFRR
jgi:polysaccharide export outer membrane protein